MDWKANVKEWSKGRLSWFWCSDSITQIKSLSCHPVGFHEECSPIFIPVGSYFILPGLGPNHSGHRSSVYDFYTLYSLYPPPWRLTGIICGWLPSSFWLLIFSCCYHFLKLLLSFTSVLSGAFKEGRGNKRKTLSFLKGLHYTLFKLSLRLCDLSIVHV